MRTVENKIDLLLSEMKNLNQKITELESNVATKQDLEKLSTKAEGIKDQVAHAQEDITEIKTSVKRIEENEPKGNQ